MASGVQQKWDIAVFPLKFKIFLPGPGTPGCLGAQFGNCGVNVYFRSLLVMHSVNVY